MNSIERIYPKFSYEQKKKIVEDLVDHQLTNKKKISSITKNLERKHGDFFGIFSLSADFNNILLWSHYAASHTGFVVGLDFKNNLSELLLSYYKTHNKIMSFFEVKYSSELPRGNIYDNDQDFLQLCMFTKAIAWSYEKEYRILLQNGPDTVATIPNGIIKRLILGCKISENNRNSVIDILRSRNDNISLFQSEISDKKFELKFRKIKY
jgi:hypothetical protein